MYRALFKKFEKYVAQLSNWVEIGNEKPASTKKFPDTGSNYREYI